MPKRFIPISQLWREHPPRLLDPIPNRPPIAKRNTAEVVTDPVGTKDIPSLSPGQNEFARSLKIPGQDATPAPAQTNGQSFGNLSPGVQAFAQGLRIPR